MGGAGTAAGNDSAMPYLNPAGLAGVPGDVFALSASVYAYEGRTYEKYFNPGGVSPQLGGYQTNESTVTAKAVHDTPSSIMYMTDLGDETDLLRHVAGVALIIPNGSRNTLIGNYDGSLPALNGTFSQTDVWSRERTEYYFGPTYSVSWEDWLRLGVSAHVLYTRLIDTLETSSAIRIGGGSAGSLTRGRRIQEADTTAFAPVAGMQVEVADYFWLGAAVAPPTIHLRGRATIQADSIGYAPDETTFQSDVLDVSTSGTVDARLNRPWRANFGIAYDDRSSFSFAADVLVFGELEDASLFEGTTTTFENRTGETSRRYREQQRASDDFKQVIDVSVGVEAALTDVVSLRAGGFTDFAASKEIDHPMLKDQFFSRYDIYGGTLGLGIQFGSFDTTVGLVGKYGTGTFYAIDNLSDTVVNANETRIVPIDSKMGMVGFIFSGVVTTEEAQQQIRDTLPPGAVPAADWTLQPGAQPPAPSDSVPKVPPKPAAVTPPAPTPVSPPAPPPPAPPPPAPPADEPETPPAPVTPDPGGEPETPPAVTPDPGGEP